MAADLQARLATAASFILQSPPGEVNDVFNDVRAIVGDDDALESGILPALEKYNIEQLIVAALPDKQQLLICQAGAVSSPSSSEPQRFIDPSTGKAWIFDHLRLSASDPLDTHVDAECEAFRVELEKHAREYAKEHFGNEGVGKVFTTAQRQLKRPSPPLSSPPAAAAAAGAQQETTEAPAEPVGAPPQSTDTEALVQEKARLDAEDPTLEETPAKVDVDNAAAENVEPAAGESAVAIQTESGEEQREHSAGEAGDTKMQSAAATPAPADGAEDAPAGDTAMDVTASAADEPAQPGPQEQQQEETVEPVEKRFSLYFVGNKYNPANYWTGRWRSSYTLDLTSPTPSLTGQVQLNVHFFEQGNVQLATTHTPSISLGSAASGNASPAEIARSALKAISKVEEEYQLELNEAYREMAEKTFRSLRRALPITKQKMDWGKVANYKLGRDLSGAQR